MTASNNPLVLREVKGSPLKFAEQDQNFSNCIRWADTWQSGDTYAKNQIVRYNGGLWVCENPAGSAVDPYTGAGTDWSILAPSPGRGGLKLDTPLPTAPDIGAAYQTLPYDAEYPFEFGVSTDPVTGEFSFLFAGIWLMSVTVNLAHNELNASRVTDLRLWNVTDSVAMQTLGIPIARNQSGTIVSLSVLSQIVAAEVGDTARWEIGGGDTLSAVGWNISNVTFSQLSAI